MKKILFSCVFLFPNLVLGAGTYYTGMYKSPQKRYSVEQFSNMYRKSFNKISDNSFNYKNIENKNHEKISEKSLVLRGGISHEFGTWNFNMNQAKSILSFNNISWNNLDLGGTYKLKYGKSNLELDFGVGLGFQSGVSSMTDDDISKGGMFISDWHNNSSYIGTEYLKVLSIGESKNGKSNNLHVSLGLSDFLVNSNAKITPIVGYRMFSYNLKTDNNHGLMSSVLFCKSDNGQTVCDPVIIGKDSSDNQFLMKIDKNGKIQNISGVSETFINNVKSFHQKGVSHNYNVSWNGPFLASKIRYDINKYNNINAYVEFGLPIYKTEADQPYRDDLAHPKSFEDNAELGKSFALSLLGEWKTVISDNLTLSFGFSHKYLISKQINATTFYNKREIDLSFEKIKKSYELLYKDDPQKIEKVEAALLSDINAKRLKNIQNNNYSETIKDEIESLYKSLGIRIGFSSSF